jgi:hypothetical protein
VRGRGAAQPRAPPTPGPWARPRGAAGLARPTTRPLAAPTPHGRSLRTKSWRHVSPVLMAPMGGVEGRGMGGFASAHGTVVPGINRSRTRKRTPHFVMPSFCGGLTEKRPLIAPPLLPLPTFLALFLSLRWGRWVQFTRGEEERKRLEGEGTRLSGRLAELERDLVPHAYTHIHTGAHACIRRTQACVSTQG